MDKLKLIGTAVGLIALVGAWQWWQSRRPADDKVVAKVTELAKQMCGCTDMACADGVADEVDKLVGTKLERRKDGMGSAYADARMQMDYIGQCYKYIAKGKSFTVETNSDGSIRMVRPDSMRQNRPGYVDVNGLLNP